MASVDPLSIGRDRKIRGLIEFSTDLLPKLPTSHDSSSTDTLLADLNHHITTVNAISQKPGTVSPEAAEDLKEAGRGLWNACIREKRKQNDVLASPSRSKLLVRTRLFSFLVNFFARESLRGRKGSVEDDAVAIINQGLMLAKICINESDLDAARLGLGKVTKYIDKLRQLDAENSIGPGHRLNIEAEYLTMRCALSSKEDRLDVAEHMYTKADDLLRCLDPFSAEQLADALQDIGTNLSGKGDHEMALKWLRRAHALINCQELERLSTEGLEIRMSIHHNLIQTLLATRSPERVQEADDLVSYKLMWKKLDASYAKREYNVAELWCRVALHPIFSSTGEVSQGKFGRRLILCAIARSDADTAKSTFDTLPTAVQNDQLTRYLMFKVSLISWDHDLGRQCVEFLSKSSEKARSRDILYACGLRPLIRVFSACLVFIECYPQDISSENSADLQLMAMRCHFVMAAAIVSKARTEDKVDEALQRYLEVRQHVAVFDGLFEKHFQDTLAARNARVYTDLTAKMSTLFVFDFEGAICLKNWDDLGQIIRKARVCKDEKMYKAMGDCLLRSNASGNVVYTNLRLIINEIFALEQFDNQRLAKYLRCMFQAVLPLDDSLALQVVEQALQIARECSQMQKPFPTDELDWIVVTTFNHALDIHVRGDGEMCQQWAHKALALAEYMSDRGDLKDILRERVAKLCLGKGTSISTSS
ncbi:hypothetical protein LRP88_07621 [Fusarium phalaenopsidis]